MIDLENDAKKELQAFFAMHPEEKKSIRVFVQSGG